MCNKNLIVSNSIFVHWLKKNTQPLDTNTVVSEEYQAAVGFFNQITGDMISVGYFEELWQFIKQYYGILLVLFNGHLFVPISSWHYFYFYIWWKKLYIIFEYLYRILILNFTVEVHIQIFPYLKWT